MIDITAGNMAKYSGNELSQRMMPMIKPMTTGSSGMKERGGFTIAEYKQLNCIHNHKKTSYAYYAPKQYGKKQWLKSY